MFVTELTILLSPKIPHPVRYRGYFQIYHFTKSETIITIFCCVLWFCYTYN